MGPAARLLAARAAAAAISVAAVLTGASTAAALAVPTSGGQRQDAGAATAPRANLAAVSCATPT